MFALSGNACYSPRIAAIDAVQGDFCVFDAGQWLEKRYDDPQIFNLRSLKFDFCAFCAFLRL